MHERSVAEDLVRAAGVAAVDEGGTVQAMHVHVGSLSCIDPEALHDQVVWWAQGTIAEGAEVVVEVVPADLKSEFGFPADACVVGVVGHRQRVVGVVDEFRRDDDCFDRVDLLFCFEFCVVRCE